MEIKKKEKKEAPPEPEEPKPPEEAFKLRKKSSVPRYMNSNSIGQAQDEVDAAVNSALVPGYPNLTAY